MQHATEICFCYNYDTTFSFPCLIDEMSMVAADMLYQINQRLQQIFQNEDTFGGVGVILVGDLLQIPPVRGKQVFQCPNYKPYKESYYLCSLWEEFEVIVFRHNHRQGEESQFVELLNRVRIGEPNDKDLSKLKDCEISEEDISFDSLHVMFTNEVKHAQNMKNLQRLEGNVVELECREKPDWYKAKDKSYGTVGITTFMRKLELKLGARVSLIHNVWTYDGLFNGALGTLKGFAYENGIVECLMVEFDNESTGKNQRLKHHKYSFKPEYKNTRITPIARFDFEYPLSSHNSNSFFHSKTAHVIQFPIQLAWATTGHRIQVIPIQHFN